MTNTWTYRENTYRIGSDLAGFDVEATDGSIGKIDEDSKDRDHLIVDTGVWIFGKRRLLPVGVVLRIDYDAEKVYVNMTKDQIKDAPDHDDPDDEQEPMTHYDEEWDRRPYEAYFGPFIW